MIVGSLNGDLPDFIVFILGSLPIKTPLTRSVVALIFHLSPREGKPIRHGLPIGPESVVMRVDNGLGHELLHLLIFNPDQLLLLHLLGDGRLGVLRVNCILEILLLDWLQVIFQFSVIEDTVELLKKIVGSGGCTVHNRIPIILSDRQVLPLEELLQMLPVVPLPVKFETVIILVHFNLLGVVPAQDFSEQPSVGEVTLGVMDLVGQVQSLQPHIHLSGQSSRNNRV